MKESADLERLLSAKDGRDILLKGIVIHAIGNALRSTASTACERIKANAQLAAVFFEDTARHLGVTDRLNPTAAVVGAAQYVKDLRSKLPARITEPDRTWLALAAFNIGLAHLEDARILAQKQKLNPDLWSDVKKALPLLALPEYYEDAKFGYARGGMPVAFVDRVRAYYDILVRQEPAYEPRLRAFPFAMSQ